jgi:Flp pilus assembly protein TadD
MKNWRSKRLLVLSILLSIGAATIPSALRTIAIFRDGHGGVKDFATALVLLGLLVAIAVVLVDMQLVPDPPGHERKTRADELGIAVIAGVALLVIDFVFVRPYDDERRARTDGPILESLVGREDGHRAEPPRPGQPSAALDPLLLQAMELYDRGQFAESVKKLELFVKEQPNSPEGHFELGRALWGRRWKGDEDAAVAELDRAVRLRPDYADAQSYLGYALHERGVLNAALEHHEKAVALDGTQPAYHYELARTLAAKNELDRAVAEFRAAIEIAPDNPHSHYELGEVLARRGHEGDLDAAIGEFGTAARLDPRSAELRNRLGMALADRGRYDDAIAAFDDAIRVAPAFDPAVYNLARVQALKGEASDAARSLAWAIRLNAEHRQHARSDEAFAALRQAPEFARAVSVTERATAP